MRRGNGAGQIFKVKDGKRRNPWRVRVTVGWEFDELKGRSKQIMKDLGYFPTRVKAEEMLNLFVNSLRKEIIMRIMITMK